MNNYCLSRFNCVRKPVRTVHVGGVEIGGDKIGIRRLVRDHLYLGWSGGHINGDLFQAY